MDIKQEIKDLTSKIDKEDVKKKASEALDSDMADKAIKKVNSMSEKIDVKKDDIKEAIKKL